MIGDSPARWKDDEIGDGDTGPSRLGRQDSENRRILKERVHDDAVFSGKAVMKEKEEVGYVNKKVFAIFYLQILIKWDNRLHQGC